MRAMKDSGIEWIGEIPHNWEILKVKDVFYRKNSKAKIVDPIVLSLTRDGVKTRDISKNEGQLAESYYNYNPVDIDDFLLNPMDLYSGANCSIAKTKGVISPAYFNLRYKGKNSAKFYDYYFKTQYWSMALFAHGKGISYDNRWTLNFDTIDRYPLPYPPPSEQQVIANFLDKKSEKIDNLIALQEETIKQLKAYKQSVITEVVTGKSKIKDNKRYPRSPLEMKDSGTEWIKKIPIGWVVYKLKNHFEFIRGLSITKKDLCEIGAEVISYGQIHSKTNNGVEINQSLIRYVEEAFLYSHPMSLMKKNDFIFADTSEDLEGCGNCVYINEKKAIFAGYHTIALKTKKASYNKYLAYLFQTDCWRSQIRSQVSGIKLFSITNKILKNADIILPDISKQQIIADYLDKKCADIDNLIAIKQEKIEQLKEYKKSLIYEYVTGKKEVY